MVPHVHLFLPSAPQPHTQRQLACWLRTAGQTRRICAMDLGLKGLRAIVSGGTKGIGRAVVETLADEGADVALCARQQVEVSDTTAALGRRGGRAIGRALDVADGRGLAAWVTDAAAELGGLDIVIANVSALEIGNSEETWRRSFE